MNILVIGDIFGKPGRNAVKELLPKIVKREKIDFVIANTENAAGGRGLTPRAADELFKYGIDVMTEGNHIWEFDNIKPYFETHNILRPLNTKHEMPGKGWATFEAKGKKIAVVSLQGQIFMEHKGPPVVSPFKTLEELIELMKLSSDIIIVDLHAEATSEKRAFAWHFDGELTALLGTHTHVQTADEEILPGGTAYITDLGMTGPHASVIGLKKEVAIHRFLTGTKKGFKVGEGDVRLEGVVISLDKDNKPKSIKRIQERLSVLLQ